MVKSVTATDFENEVLHSGKPVLVDFYADWCGPCKILAPIIDEVSNEMENQVDFAKINIDQNSGISDFFGVMSIPTLILFKDGVERIRLVGVQPKDTLINTIMGNINE